MFEWQDPDEIAKTIRRLERLQTKCEENTEEIRNLGVTAVIEQISDIVRYHCYLLQVRRLIQSIMSFLLANADKAELEGLIPATKKVSRRPPILAALDCRQEECVDEILSRGLVLDSCTFKLTRYISAHCVESLEAVIARSNFVNCWNNAGFSEGVEDASFTWILPPDLSCSYRWRQFNVDVKSRELLIFAPPEIPRADVDNPDMLITWMHLPYTSVSLIIDFSN
jgi:hypothetical protein